MNHANHIFFHSRVDSDDDEDDNRHHNSTTSRTSTHHHGHSSSLSRAGGDAQPPKTIDFNQSIHSTTTSSASDDFDGSTGRGTTTTSIMKNKVLPLPTPPSSYGSTRGRRSMGGILPQFATSKDVVGTGGGGLSTSAAAITTNFDHHDDSLSWRQYIRQQQQHPQHTMGLSSGYGRVGPSASNTQSAEENCSGYHHKLSSPPQYPHPPRPAHDRLSTTYGGMSQSQPVTSHQRHHNMNNMMGNHHPMIPRNLLPRDGSGTGWNLSSMQLVFVTLLVVFTLYSAQNILKLEYEAIQEQRRYSRSSNSNSRQRVLPYSRGRTDFTYNPKTIPTTRGRGGFTTNRVVDDYTIINNNNNPEEVVNDQQEQQQEEDPSIPYEYRYIANFNEPVLSGDIPVFWHIPKSGGSTVKEVFTCLRLTMAAEVGETEGHENDTELQVFYIDKNRWVNVATTDLNGIEKARRWGLTQSGMADVIVTSYANQIATLFINNQHRGHMFAVLRHPIDRAVSMFNYMAYADWEPFYEPAFKEMTLEQYAQSQLVENNWMTRFLSGQHIGPLEEEHFVEAKAILGSKFLIGLLSELNTSVARFVEYYGWTEQGLEYASCLDKFLSEGVNKNPFIAGKQQAVQGSTAYQLLEEQNNYDIQLYQFAEELFRIQSDYFTDPAARLIGGRIESKKEESLY